MLLLKQRHESSSCRPDTDSLGMQAVSLLLNDPVPFRFQWPRNAELKVNQMAYRVYSRQASSKIGNNVRDEPANLATTTFAGQNRIRLKVWASCCVLKQRACYPELQKQICRVSPLQELSSIGLLCMTSVQARSQLSLVTCDA